MELCLAAGTPRVSPWVAVVALGVVVLWTLVAGGHCGWPCCPCGLLWCPLGVVFVVTTGGQWCHHVWLQHHHGWPQCHPQPSCPPQPPGATIPRVLVSLCCPFAPQLQHSHGDRSSPSPTCLFPRVSPANPAMGTKAIRFVGLILPHVPKPGSPRCCCRAGGPCPPAAPQSPLPSQGTGALFRIRLAGGTAPCTYLSPQDPRPLCHPAIDR